MEPSMTEFLSWLADYDLELPVEAWKMIHKAHLINSREIVESVIEAYSLENFPIDSIITKKTKSPELQELPESPVFSNSKRRRKRSKSLAVDPFDIGSIFTTILNDEPLYFVFLGLEEGEFKIRWLYTGPQIDKLLDTKTDVAPGSLWDSNHEEKVKTTTGWENINDKVVWWDPKTLPGEILYRIVGYVDVELLKLGSIYSDENIQWHIDRLVNKDWKELILKTPKWSFQSLPSPYETGTCAVCKRQQPLARKVVVGNYEKFHGESMAWPIAADERFVGDVCCSKLKTAHDLCNADSSDTHLVSELVKRAERLF
jgi:hypothetical protein